MFKFLFYIFIVHFLTNYFASDVWAVIDIVDSAINTVMQMYGHQLTQTIQKDSTAVVVLVYVCNFALWAVIAGRLIYPKKYKRYKKKFGLSFSHQNNQSTDQNGPQDPKMLHVQRLGENHYRAY